MITVGTDTYVTVAEATGYINQNYPSTDSRVTQWANLSETDKEVFLRNACFALSNLTYPGITLEAFQKLPFPRYYQTNVEMPLREAVSTSLYLYPEYREVPSAVKHAQIEEAFERACPSSDTKTSDAKNGAVSSYSIGHLSETFKQPSNSVEIELKSSKAQGLIEPYVRGAYDIV